MHKAIEQIEAYDIPTHSYVAAIQYINEGAELTDADYLLRIEQLVGYSVEITAEHMPRYVYLYLVQEIIRTSLKGEDFRVVNVYDIAYKRAEEFLEMNQYIFATSDDTKPVKLDAAGNVKPKKGAKKELAKKVYVADIEGKELSRKDAIAILMEKVGLSAGGASTYYANLKNGKM